MKGTATAIPTPTMAIMARDAATLTQIRLPVHRLFDYRGASENDYACGNRENRGHVHLVNVLASQAVKHITNRQIGDYHQDCVQYAQRNHLDHHSLFHRTFTRDPDCRLIMQK
jgi:hypothetical protein